MTPLQRLEAAINDYKLALSPQLRAIAAHTIAVRAADLAFASSSAAMAVSEGAHLAGAQVAAELAALLDRDTERVNRRFGVAPERAAAIAARKRPAHPDPEQRCPHCGGLYHWLNPTGHNLQCDDCSSIVKRVFS